MREQLLAKRPTRASYSAISTHESCGAAYYFSYIAGMDQYSGPAAGRGTRLHTSGELFLRGELAHEKLPVDYWKVKPMMQEYKKRKAQPEVVWRVDREWTVVEEDDKTFLKCVIDIHWRERKTLHIRDLKTGNIYQREHTDQLQLYGTVGLVQYPAVKEVVVGGVYIDQGYISCEATYPRKMLPYLMEHWTERAMRVLTDEEFRPNPSPANCKYCAYNGKKGGPCAAGV